MTIRQKQLLLAYLGYYSGSIDGLWGKASTEATRAFQQDFMDRPDGIFGPATEAAIRQTIAQGEQTRETGFWQRIRWFSREEFACPCGSCGGFPAEPEEILVRVADRIRQNFGSPVTVSSGVRCKSRNSAVGGVSNSRHLTGKAMDFCVKGQTARTVLAFVQQQPEIRYSYAIDENFVHMDIA